MPQPNAYAWDLQSLSRDVQVVFGSFAPANTGTITSAKGDGWAATRSAAGKFTITFTYNYQDLICAFGSVQDTADDEDFYVQFGDYSSTNRTLVLKTKTGGTNTDIIADANNRVSFVAVFKKTSTTPQNTASVS